MGGFLSLIYGVAVYVFFLGTFLYAIGFIGNVWVPKTIDSGAAGPLVEALIVNLALLGLFAVQHSVMARRSFKRWWTQIVPPAVERSTYVLAATLALALLLWQWRPISQPVIWKVEDPVAVQALWGVFWLGWGILLLATFLINHFELFGLLQVVARLTGREVPQGEFRTPFIYQYVRHPIYLGFILGMWGAPVMTAGHLLFAAGGTGYILVGIWFEERDLIHQFGDRYRAYREQVGMILPWRWSENRGQSPDSRRSTETETGL
jgi:protein-S-isoprenylcysteine O-methyltransferase Ste14